MAQYKQPQSSGRCDKCRKTDDLWMHLEEEEKQCPRCGDFMSGYNNGYNQCSDCFYYQYPSYLCHECFKESTGQPLGNKCQSCGQWDDLMEIELSGRFPEERSSYSSILTKNEQHRYFGNIKVFVCQNCKHDQETVTDNDLGKSYNPKANILENFKKRAILSKLGVIIVEEIFKSAGYETRSNGVENTRHHIATKNPKDPNAGFKKARSEPDLEVSEKDGENLWFVEVKTTSRSPDQFKYPTSQLMPLINYHPDAILVIYHIPSGTICARKVSDINWDSLPTSGDVGELEFHLEFAIFKDLTEIFNKISPKIIEEQKKVMCELFRNYFVGLELSTHFTNESF